MTTWVSWRLLVQSKDSTRAHAGIRGVRPMDVRNGGFPLECGRWAPEGWDATVEEARGMRRCRQCEKAIASRLVVDSDREREEGHEEDS